MSSRVWERLGAATGILAALMFVVIGIFDPGELPEATDPATEFASFVSEQGSNLRAQAFAIAIFAILLLWFLGSLRASLRRAEGGEGRLSSIAFGGGVATATMILVSGGIQAQTFFQDIESLSPQRIRDLWLAITVVGDAVFGGSTFARAVLVGAASWCAIRFGGLPKWLGWLGAVVALASLVGGVTILEAPDEGVFGGIWFISLGAFFVWLLIAGIVLTIRPGTAAAER